jgi:hypothetical protein
MKKILIQLDSDEFASVFDTIAAYDSGVDQVLQYGGVTPNDVRDLVYGAIFTRGPEDLRNSAVFIGGSDVATGEKMLNVAQKSFLGPLQVSVMLDANGCNTTAAAAVDRILSAAELENQKIVVLAGTGPVGLRAAALFAQEGASVTLTSRTHERADAAAASINERFGVQVTGAGVADEDGIREVLTDAKAVLTAGAAGVQLLPESVWVEHPTLRVLGDVNAVPPLGIEGIKVHWKGKEKHGKLVYGAIGIGDFKMKIHHASVARLFEQNDLVLDAEEVYATAKELSARQ